MIFWLRDSDPFRENLIIFVGKTGSIDANMQINRCWFTRGFFGAGNPGPLCVIYSLNQAPAIPAHSGLKKVYSI
jgi:hypothetical protein